MADPTPKRPAQSVEATRERVCSGLAPLICEQLPLHAALGRTLAQPVISARAQPPFRASAMDGYALRLESLRQASEHLRVIGEAAAGRAFQGEVRGAEAVRLFTGAPVPEGADVVVPQERTRHAPPAGLAVESGYARDLTPGVNVRPSGVDFAAGTLLIAAGTRLHARHLALVAAAGSATVTVHRRPEIALLANGDEIRAPGESVGPFDIYDAVTPGLAAMVEAWGGRPRPAAAAPDEERAFTAAVRAAAEGADALVIVGGASVGDRDLSRGVLTALGLSLQVASVAIRPGKPTWFGTLPLAGVPAPLPVLGLPGNPAAAFVCAQLFLRALIETLLGRRRPPAILPATLEGELPATTDQEHYVRAHAHIAADGRLTVRPDPRQDTSLVSVYAHSNALVRRPAHTPTATSGGVVDVLLLEDTPL